MLQNIITCHFVPILRDERINTYFLCIFLKKLPPSYCLPVIYLSILENDVNGWIKRNYVVYDNSHSIQYLEIYFAGHRNNLLVF